MNTGQVFNSHPKQIELITIDHLAMTIRNEVAHQLPLEYEAQNWEGGRWPQW